MQIDAPSTPLLLALALLATVLAGPPDALARGSGSQAVGTQEQPAGEPERVPPPPPPPVEVSFSGPLLVVEPRVSGVATSVYVSCADGTYIHRELEGVSAALVEVVRTDGTPLTGGPAGEVRCKYEVYVHPPVDREAMRIAEEQGDFATIERLSRIEQEQIVISRGGFRVTGGAAVPPIEKASDH